MTTLEKIRADIKNQLFVGRILNSKDFDDGLKWCLELIDKYADQGRKAAMMTNAEKFSEVFGFDHNTERCPFPSVVCEDRVACDDCPLVDFWEKEYKPCFKLRSDFGRKADAQQLEDLHMLGYTV